MKYTIVIAAVVGLLLFSGKKKNNSITSILFIGDSNTATPFSYADQLAKKFPTIRMKKIALIGAKTDWILAQLKSELTKNKYDLVCVMGGSNDIYALSKIDNAEQNLNSIYNISHQNGAKVLAITPPNKNFFIKRTDLKQKLLFSLINWIKSNQNTDYFVNFWDITNNKSFFTVADGFLHAQSPAHKILANTIINTINLVPVK
ncbi:MAG: hypothetical protein H7331_07910 [Bacteroidia bacterium]|nr:hypothetical protein [Bacteroidia bacterium]